jgi:hypothetical protein
MRDISDILLFRGDISPFLAHLTRTHDGIDAPTRLNSILSQRQLLPGPNPVSDTRFGSYAYYEMFPDERQRFFGAVCFTETPVSEVHCLLEISGRAVDLEPYGLLFEKDRLKKRGVAPVVYLNNETGDVRPLLATLFRLKDVPEVAQRLLPLISTFGQKVCAGGQMDFTWEREWRYPAGLGPLTFSFDDVFCGLCPHEQIADFELRYWPLKFIDPLRNMKWYARSLVESRQRLKLKYSVV